jgi:tetratricopeptide (TPR) repeat protein
LWSQDYDYPAKDILNVEDDVARAVAREIQLRLTSQQQAELSRPRPVNPEAFDAYMQGYYFFERNTNKDADMAAKYYERAIQLDPGYALAWVGLSRARYWQANKGLVSTEEGQRLAREAVERALALDPNLPQASWENLGEIRFCAGQVDEAVADLKKALELSPDVWLGWNKLAQIHLMEGRPEDALREIERVQWAALRLRMYAMAYHALGREKESDAALRELIDKYHSSAAFSIAIVYSFRNQRDEAFRWLDRAYAQHDTGLIWTKVEPLLKNLHGDPRYTAFLKKINLPT